MTATKLETEVLLNEEINEGVFRLTLLAPDIAKLASPGQFIMVRASSGDGLPLLRRPFSIHQVMDGGRIQILFKTIGKGTTYLAGCRSGDVLNLVGPLGRGFDFTNCQKNVCLVGGGMGVAPLFYLAGQMLASNTVNSITVLLGASSAREIDVLRDDLVNLGATVYTATDDGSEGHHGLVTDLLADRLDHSQIWSVYSCGPHPMMKAVAEFCLGRGWPCQVSLETLMACGISACLGCAIRGSDQIDSSSPYLHVCKDGPVFTAGEVAW